MPLAVLVRIGNTLLSAEVAALAGARLFGFLLPSSRHSVAVRLLETQNGRLTDIIPIDPTVSRVDLVQ